ncbi:MAG: hypothetical protein MUD15_08335 [Desulfobacterota bacterium]|nr:hypothetical protein [Thermodesulfobacteriota bacterium]
MHHSKGIARDPQTGILRRHHAHPTNLQKAVRSAAKLALIHKPVGCHTFRHSTHVMQWGAGGVRSPLDLSG